MEEKKHITVNTDVGKSAVMYIKGRKEKNERTINEEVKKGRINKVDEYKFLGTWISEKGYMTNIEKIKKKVPAMVSTTKNIGCASEVGIMTIPVRMELLEAAIIRVYCTTTWKPFPLTKKEMDELESILHNILVQLLEMPTGTPYNGILMETGIWNRVSSKSVG